MSDHNFLVLDIGTTGAKALVFDAHEEVVARAYQSIAKTTPRSGWVEQDPDELINAARAVIATAVEESGVKKDTLLSMGIADQRETIVAWDLVTGEALAPAIVWEDTRTEEMCNSFYKDTVDIVREKTGLPLISTYSATKIRWLLENNTDVAEAEKAGRLAVGTVDSWALFSLSRERRHMCDITNASRTLLYNIHSHQWDRELLEVFSIERDILPSVRSSRSLYGTLQPDICGVQVPIEVLCGDQQASMAAVGFVDHMVKITYGTGTFIMQTLGDEFLLEDDFITTLTPDSLIGSVQYALEARIPGTGARVADALGDKRELESVLKEIAHSVQEILEKLPYPADTIIVDGGISRSDHLVDLQADLSNAEVVRQPIHDGTALGVMRLLASIHHGT